MDLDFILSLDWTLDSKYFMDLDLDLDLLFQMNANANPRIQVHAVNGMTERPERHAKRQSGRQKDR